MKTTNKTIWIGEVGTTPIGPIWAAVSDGGLIAVDLGADEVSFRSWLEKRHKIPVVLDPQKAAAALSQIDDYLHGDRIAFDLPIDWSVMSSFQQRVLKETLAIPAGEVATYGEIAHRIGNPRGARAVGRALATNPMPLVIPCHRVVGVDGLRGFGAPGKLKTKAWLLNLEGFQVDQDLHQT